MADDHAGRRAARREALAEAAYQRYYVHFLRNAFDYVPRRVDDDCLQELRWLCDRRDLAEAPHGSGVDGPRLVPGVGAATGYAAFSSSRSTVSPMTRVETRAVFGWTMSLVRTPAASA